MHTQTVKPAIVLATPWKLVLSSDNAALSAGLDISLFRLVCSIPYGGVGKRTTDWIFRHKVASCSGKHILLGGLYELSGHPVRYLMGECDLSFLNSYLPGRSVISQGTPDFHNFIQVYTSHGWITVDATFGPREKQAGFPSNMDWDGKGDCDLIFPSHNIREVGDIQTAKLRALAKLPKKLLTKRKQALEKLITYLDSESRGK